MRYSFDDVGNIVQTVDVTPNPVDDTQCFSYDYLRRLTDAWTPTSGACGTSPSTAGLGGPAPYWHSWTFDAAGNRISQTVHTTTGNKTTAFGYPTPGSAQPHTVTTTAVGPLVQNYKYDASGHSLCRPSTLFANTCPSGSSTGSGSQNLTWDREGHLDSSTDSAGTNTYVYDADGNRIIRRDPAGKTLYLPGEEIRYNTATATSVCTRYYSYGPTTIASRTIAGLTWLAGDHHGTATAAIDATSQATTLRRHDPYGNSRGTATAWPNDKGFVGGTQDNTGLTHLGAREYDPTLGTFISDDLITDTNDPQQINGYTYANSAPTTASDATGLRPYEEPERSNGTWFEYYLKYLSEHPDNVPKTGDYSETTGCRTTGKTLFGAAAVYDKDGKLLWSDDTFRSGGGLLENETGRIHQHVEPRVVSWFRQLGLLKPGNTLTIVVNGENSPCDACMSVLKEAADSNGIRVLYVDLNGQKRAEFGEVNSSAKLEGEPVRPRQAGQPSLFEPDGKGGSTSGEAPSTRGGGVEGEPTRGGGMAEGAGAALGIIGLFSDLYFVSKYGPETMVGCYPGQVLAYMADGLGCWSVPVA